MDSIGVWFWVWVVAAAVLLIAEIFTAGFFMLPFGLGAAVTAVLAFLEVPIGIQWVVFIAVSSIAFVLSRRFVDHITHDPPTKTGVDRLLGKTGVVIEQIAPNDYGQVRIEREEWRADAPGHGHIAVGAMVIVEGVEGTHLVVSPVSGAGQ